jgi:NADH-ubiquinone oxidoreductase chain 5
LFSFFSCSMWFMPLISTVGVVFYPLNYGFRLFKFIDQGWTEFFGIQQIFSYFIGGSKIFQVVQFNNLKIHLILFCFWIFVLCVFMFIFL